MKINSLLLYCNKHKTVCLFLFFCLLLVGLLFKNTILEGLESNIGEYGYLAPPVNTNISDELYGKLVNKLKATCKQPMCDMMIGATKTDWNQIATIDEINYYIQNGSFPWDSYVTNALYNKNKTQTPDITEAEIQKIINDTRQVLPNRIAYGFAAGRDESGMNPQPLSYQIYMGTAQPPPTPTPTTTPTPTSTTTANNYYNEFVSLCKKVSPV